MAKSKKKPSQKLPRAKFSDDETKKRLRERPQVKARLVAQARKGKNRSNLA